MVAINKPPGLLVHRSAIDKHETRFALQMVRDCLGKRVYPVHRLDKPTSGVLLFALDSGTARHMMELFSQAGVSKSYLAVVRGYTEQSSLIDYPLLEQWDKMTDAKAKRDKAPQSAVTAFERLATVELDYPVGPYQTTRYSLLDVRPRTGRKHQIRRHLKHIFHPVIGDTTHGDGKHNRFFRDRFENRQLLLHAYALSFEHPVSGQPIRIKAGLNQGFERIVETLAWRKVLEELLQG